METMETVEPADVDRLFDENPNVEQHSDQDQSWNIPEMNPWLLLALAGLAYYVYQNYLSNIRLPTRGDENRVTPQDEEKVRQMMEARSRQQAQYDQAAKDLEEKMKDQPPPKVGPISKQIAAKAKLRPEYNPLMGDQNSGGQSRRFARASAGGG